MAISVVRSAAGNTGAASPATTDANLGAASTTGNLLILIVSCNATVNTPSGWTQDRSQVNSNAHYVFSKYSAGETTVTITPTTSAGMSWWIAELALPAASSPLAATTSTGSGTAAATRSTGTTSSTSGATGGIAIASFGDSIAGGGSATWSSYTNSFVETADTITTTGATNVGLAVATVAVAADGTFECTGTPNTSVKSTGIITVYKPLVGSTVTGTVAFAPTFTRTIAGTPTVNGTIAPTYTPTITVAGTPTVKGTVAPTFALSVGATGTRKTAGTVAFAPTFAPTIVGDRVRHGTITATFTLTAAAFGEVPPPVTVVYGNFHGNRTALAGRMETGSYP